MTQTILIVGGGIEAVEGVRIAKEMGLRVAVLDRNPHAPARLGADDFVLADVYDAAAAAEAARHFALSHLVDGVIALAVDAPLTVAHIAATLGIPGPTIETAELATDKLRMKERFKTRGIPIPWFSQVRNADHLREIYGGSRRRLVLKPVDSRGARGVLRLDKSVDLHWAYDHSRSFSPSGRVMVEEWLSGPQISTESVVYDDQSALCGTGDRNYDRLEETFPYVVEDGGGCPSQLSPATDREFDQLMLRSAQAIGLRRGTIKGDLVRAESGLAVIEVAARLSGGYFSTHTIPFVYGINLVGAAIDIALGKRPDIEAIRLAKVRQHQSNRFFFLPQGTVTAVRNTERVAAYPWVKVLEVYVKAGDTVGKVSDHTCRGGTIMTFGASREEAEERAERALAEVDIRIDKHLP